MQLTRIFVAAALAAIVASPAMAQDRTVKASLKAQARISEDSARVIALSKVASGSTIRESELEHEKGTVVWSFDIKEPGKSGVAEVLVSALDGHVVAQSHESAKDERAEATKEKKDKKVARKKP